MKHFFFKFAWVVPMIAFAGCTTHVVHPGSAPTETVIIGGYPHYDVWPAPTFYYDNWGVYGGGGYHHHHHHHHGHHGHHGHHHHHH